MEWLPLFRRDRAVADDFDPDSVCNGCVADFDATDGAVDMYERWHAYKEAAHRPERW